ncbi:MAG: HAAS signaling domain-containing protein [Methanothermobacter sp.]
MNKDEYLKELTRLLRKLPKEEREDILSDYREHFTIGIEKGRSEEEIAKALGDPKTVAKQMNAEYTLKKAEDKQSTGNVFEAILAAAGLGIFNLIFVAVPALILMAIILILFAIGGVVILWGVIMILSNVFYPIFPHNNFYIQLPGGILGVIEGILIGFGLTILGVGLIAGMAYMTRWLYGLAIRYLRYNIRIIEERRGKKLIKGG